MLRKGILLIVFAITNAVDGAILIIVFLRDWALQVWKDNAVRKWVFWNFNLFNSLFLWLRRYLEGVGVIIQYRIYYQSVTAPMKSYYRELKYRRFNYSKEH